MAISLGPSGLTFDSGSNYQDDYEKGTWVPRITDSSGGTTLSSSVGCGYVIVGDVTYLFGYAYFTNITTTFGSNNIFLETPTTPSTFGGQSSVDVLLPMWNIGSAGTNYWDSGYPSISASTNSVRHPLFKHGYNGFFQLDGNHLTNNYVSINFNSFFYVHA